MARQPIFNKNLEVYGYELLYRSTDQVENYTARNGFISTASVLGNLFENGVLKIVEDKKAFVNFDEDGLMSKIVELFPSNQLVVEILENVKDTEVICEKLMDLTRKGYMIALDDYEKEYDTYQLSRLSRIIKFDLLLTPLHTIGHKVKEAKDHGKIILAEKVESNEMFVKAKNMGFDLFQGYFFCKPITVGRNYKKASTKNQYFRILIELEKEEPSYQKLAEIIEMDVTLSYRVLRVIGGKFKDESFHSIKKALTFIGLNELKHWISVLLVQDLSDDKPNELMRLSLIRSKFAERIALRSKLKHRKFEASLLGLFSLIDAILDESMEVALEDSAISKSIKDTLIRQEGPLKELLDILIAYEKGEWNVIREFIKAQGIDSGELLKDYKYAIEWAHTVLLLI